MSDASQNAGDAAARRTPEKDPDEWTTGGEPMTGPQASYLETLCREAGREFDPNLSKADASKLIDELQRGTGRGQGATTAPIDEAATEQGKEQLGKIVGN